MKIKITDKKSSLVVGRVYDLCDMAANHLISKRFAVLVVDKATEPVTDKKEKTDAPKTK
jgi:hypothetical protein